MAKVSGSYKSLIRGVSQQAPEERLPGQHGAQVNMLSDPVRGLVRRRGTVFVASTAVAGAPANRIAQAYAAVDTKIEDRELTLMLKRPGGYEDVVAPVYVIQRGAYASATDGAVVPVSVSPAAAALLSAGVTAQAVVGRYLLLAHAAPITATLNPLWDTIANKARAYVQVRGQAYSRTFKVTVGLSSGASLVASYTTPASSYGGVLDTTDILATDPEYQKKVNDRINLYNSAVTSWLGTAAAAVQPLKIAESLRTALIAVLPAGIVVTQAGATLQLAHVSGPTITSIAADDGGDASLLKATWQSIKAAEDLPPNAENGKVVQVAPAGEDSFYLRADTRGGVGFTEVRWVECPSVEHTPVSPFAIATLSAGSLVVAASPVELESLVPGITVPRVAGRKAGDDESSPAPAFVGRTITYMGVFQDRLLIGSRNTINASRIGDYFNFYRTSALTVPDDDAVEVQGNSSEDDVLYYGVFFDRSLVLFGDKQQYVLSGKVPLTPATATMVQSSAHRDATHVRPVGVGDLLFFAKRDGSASSLHQIAVGNVDDTTNSQDVTGQLDDYIKGTCQQVVGVSKPEALALRASGHNGLYVFRYVDSAGERLLDSWSRWDFHPACGALVAIGVLGERLRLTFAREQMGVLYFVTDEAQLTPGSPDRPYLDSLSSPAVRTDLSSMHCAYGAETSPQYSWQGRPDADYAQLIADIGLTEDPAGFVYVGYPFESSVTLTSPFPRDSNDAPIVIGRTTITSLLVSLARSVGVRISTTTAYIDAQAAVNFTGNLVGSVQLGHIVPASTVVRAMIGREVREYEATIHSRLWYPLAVTSIDWVGQFFNNTRRV